MADQNRSSDVFGYLLPQDSTIDGTFLNSAALNSATTFVGFSFVPSASTTLNTVVAYLGTVGGAPIAADLTCYLYSDTAGAPNTSLEGPKTQATAPSAGIWLTFSGFTTALTAGTQYWIVFKNANATPATNYPAYYFMGPDFLPAGSTGGSSLYGWNKKATTDGTNWTAGTSTSVAMMRVGYSDGSYDGFPVSGATALGAADGVYSARESGAKFTLPNDNVTRNVKGIAMYVKKTGTPTGNLRFRLYNNTTLLGTTNVIGAAYVDGITRLIRLSFASPIAVPAGTVVRAVVAEDTQSDTNVNYFSTSSLTIHNDANSKALMPYTNMQKTYLNSTWTDTDTEIVPAALILDTTSGRFTATGTNLFMVCE